MARLEEIAKSLIEGQESKVEELTQSALAEGINVTEILNDGLLSGMDEVGKRFREADMFIPEVLLAAKAMNAGMNILKPLLAGSGFHNLGKIVLGTVRGDVHEIGKNLVGIMLTGAGFEVIDLGPNVAPEKFIETAVEEKVGLIGMSALLTVTMPSMKDTVEELRKAGLENQIKTMIGGAPVTQRYADEIGADGYAEDAPSAVTKAKELLNLS
jgi:5-methyltetrahydrofolate--homocysteine methyltransferase